MVTWFNEMYSGLGPAMQAVLTASGQASVLIVLVLGVQFVFGRWLSPRWRYALWSVVVIRLMMPVAPGSTLSVFNLFRADVAPPVAVMELSTAPATMQAGTIDMTNPGPVTPVTAAVAPQAEQIIRWSAVNIAMSVWLAGVGLVMGVLLLINVLLVLRLRRREALTDPGLIELLEACKQEVGMKREVRLVVSPSIASPALAGMFRPTLLLPAGLLEDLPRDELRFILLHELAHVKKHDIAMNWLLIALSALHWFNPLVWFAFTRLRADREMARDAMVLRATGTDASQAYGQTIIRVLERLSRPRLHNPALAGIGDGMGQLKRRLRMIAVSPKRRPVLTFVGMTLLTCLAVIGLTDAAETKAPYTPPQTTEASSSNEVGDIIQPDQRSSRYRVEFDQVPLQDAIEQVREQIDVPLFINWDALKASGVDRDELIKMTVITQSSDMLVLIMLRASSDQKGLYAPAVKMIDGVLTASTVRDLGGTTDTRVYDIRHLLSGPGPEFDLVDGEAVRVRPEKSPRELQVDQLLELIRGTVGYTEEWAAQGGDLSSAKELNDNLIVKTTEKNHEGVITLLAQLAETRSLQVSYESMFMLLTDTAIENAGAASLLSDIESGARIAFLDDAQAGRLRRMVTQDAGSIVLAAPRVTQRNGERASLEISTETAYISDYTQPEGGGAPEPVLKTVREGIYLDVQATVSADRRYVTSSLKPRMTNVAQPIKKRIWSDNPGGEALFVEEPAVSLAEVDITVSMPDKGTLLIDLGEVTGPMVEAEDKADEDAIRRVYALIKPTVILASEGDTGFHGMLDDNDGTHVGQVTSGLSPEASRSIDRRATPAPDPLGIEPENNDDWRELFDRAYRLEEGEVVKRIVPPFIPQRIAYYRKTSPHQAGAIPGGPDVMFFRWKGELQWWGTTFGRPANIDQLIQYVLELRSYEYRADKELLATEIPGDWVYDLRSDESVRRRALIEAINEATGRQLTVELKPIECDVIVASGEWEFTPLAESYDASRIHVFVGDELDPDEGSGGSSGTIDEFFVKVGSRIGVRFDNQLKNPPAGQQEWGWHRSSRLRDIDDPEQHATRLRSLLNSLTKQTGLTFKVERRVEDVWVISE